MWSVQTGKSTPRHKWPGCIWSLCKFTRLSRRKSRAGLPRMAPRAWHLPLESSLPLLSLCQRLFLQKGEVFLFESTNFPSFSKQRDRTSWMKGRKGRVLGDSQRDSGIPPVLLDDMQPLLLCVCSVHGMYLRPARAKENGVQYCASSCYRCH